MKYKRVTDGARTRDLRSHKWVVGALGSVEVGLLRARECPDEGRLQCDCSMLGVARGEAMYRGRPKDGSPVRLAATCTRFHGLDAPSTVTVACK